MSDLQQIYNMGYGQYTDLMRQRSMGLQPIYGHQAQMPQMQMQMQPQSQNNGFAQGQALGGALSDFTSGYFGAGGFGLGEKGYGMAYGIDPGGEQAKMLAEQWR
jgi:hypothetical protein